MTEFNTSIPVAPNMSLELLHDDRFIVPLFSLIDRNREHLSQFGDVTAAKYPTLQSVHDSVRYPRNIARDRYAILADSEVVGSINSEPTGDKETSFEIGYYLGKEYTGRGYATLAVHGLAVNLLSRPGVRLINAYTHPDNTASQAVLRRAGFVFHSEPRSQHRYVATPGSVATPG